MRRGIGRKKRADWGKRIWWKNNQKRERKKAGEKIGGGQGGRGENWNKVWIYVLYYPSCLIKADEVRKFDQIFLSIFFNKDFDRIFLNVYTSSSNSRKLVWREIKMEISNCYPWIWDLCLKMVRSVSETGKKSKAIVTDTTAVPEDLPTRCFDTQISMSEKNTKQRLAVPRAIFFVNMLHLAPHTSWSHKIKVEPGSTIELIAKEIWLHIMP